jgi:hypothetical protein
MGREIHDSATENRLQGIRSQIQPSQQEQQAAQLANEMRNTNLLIVSEFGEAVFA